MMNRPMEIDIWKGDWGLPSIDLDCLQTLVSKYNNNFIRMVSYYFLRL